MGEQEHGKCMFCGKADVLKRTVYYYGIQCDCHSPEHFEVAHHCSDCKPYPPETTTVWLKPTNKE